MASFIESATTRNIVGNEGNFVMTQLNAASQPIKSHVAVRAASKQTRKHWSLLTTSVLGWVIPKEAQRGVWMLSMCVCVCGHVVFVCSSVTEIPVSSMLLRKVLMEVLCHQLRYLNLRVCEISLKGGNVPKHGQLSPFELTNLFCLPKMLWHFTQSPFGKQSNWGFLFFKFAEDPVPWD